MNDEQFEGRMQIVEVEVSQLMANQLRARNTAQREALARVEAERDTAIVQMQNIRKQRDAINKKLGDAEFNLCIAHQQLAEAVGLIRETLDEMFFEEYPKLEDFLSRIAQAEQKEAKPATFYDAIKNPPRMAPTLAEAQGAQAGDEREAFESTLDPSLSRETFVDEEGDTVYRDTWVQGAWIGWSRRAALATQPAAGEPVYQWFDGKDWKDCASRRDCFHIQASGFPIREVKSVPPAAAHGDEAVRKDAEYFRFIESCPIRTGVVFSRKAHEAGFDLRAECERVMAMRAQGDGESV